MINNTDFILYTSGIISALVFIILVIIIVLYSKHQRIVNQKVETDLSKKRQRKILLKYPVNVNNDKVIRIFERYIPNNYTNPSQNTKRLNYNHKIHTIFLDSRFLNQLNKNNIESEL